MEIKKTNIILLLENIDYDGGVERVVCNMANSFIKNENNEVTIMSIFKNKNSPQYNIDKRIKIDSLNLSDSAQSYINNFMIKSSLLIRLKLNKDIADKLYQKLNKDIKYYILCNSYLFSPLYRSKNTKLIGIDHSRFPYNLKENKFIHYVRTLNVRQMDIITTLNNDELEKTILNFDAEEYRKNCHAHYQALGGCEAGKAAEMVCDRIYQVCFSKE